MTWQDRLASHRMRVDREFVDRVREAAISRRQWDLAMTAIEFRFEDADDPDEAELVADTSKVESVVPELRSMPDEGAGGGGDGAGLLDGLRSALGIGGEGVDVEGEVERLASAYAEELEAELVRSGAWDDLRRAAAGE